MDTNTYCIYSQSSIFNTNADTFIPFLKVGKIFVRLKTNSTNNSTLWQFLNDCNDIRLEVYCTFAKSKSVVRKLEVIIFLYNLI